jgi:hypothetical protein
MRQMTEAALRRRLEKIPAEATAGRPGWVLIENEGALFRGFSRGWPQEVWFPSRGWGAYADAGNMKPIEWGDVISESTAAEMMREWINDLLQRAAPS